MANKGHVLVAGGAGYIGSHVCKALHKKGFTPVVIDNFGHGYSEFVKWGPTVEADIWDEESIAQLIDQFSPVAVLHFAAFIDVSESVSDPKKYYQNNLAGTLAFLNLLVEKGIKRVVFSSTAAVYGEPVEVPIKESHRLVPISPYGKGKFFVEQILADFERAYGMSSVVFRYFNAAGADADGELGEDHVPETHLIPLVLDAACGRKPSITVFGTDYDTPDGTCIRDYIHVSDLADAHVLALEYLLKGGESKIYNLGNGHGYSVKDVIDVVEDVTGKKVPIVEGARREGDPGILVADSGLVRKELGWQPKYSSLSDIVGHAYAFYKTRFLK